MFRTFLIKHILKLLINLLGRYARVVDQLAVRDVAQGAPLGGGSTLHSIAPHWNSPRPLLQAVQPPRNHGQKPSWTMYRIIQ